VEGHLRRVLIEPRVLVGGEGVLAQVEHFVHRRPDREGSGPRETEQGRELVKIHFIDAVLPEAVAHVLGEREIACGTGHVRLLGEVQQVPAVGIRARRAGEDLLDRRLDGGCPGNENQAGCGDPSTHGVFHATHDIERFRGAPV
jgi:hypothetical protein